MSKVEPDFDLSSPPDDFDVSAIEKFEWHAGKDLPIQYARQWNFPCQYGFYFHTHDRPRMPVNLARIWPDTLREGEPWRWRARFGDGTCSIALSEPQAMTLAGAYAIKVFEQCRRKFPDLVLGVWRPFDEKVLFREATKKLDVARAWADADIRGGVASGDRYELVGDILTAMRRSADRGREKVLTAKQVNWRMDFDDRQNVEKLLEGLSVEDRKLALMQLIEEEGGFDERFAGKLLESDFED